MGQMERRKGKRKTQSNSVSEEIVALLNTLRELAAIRTTAEDAATRILDSAEGLLTTKDDAEKAEEAILSIMTACSFHDLIGQRVAKITETLDQVIATSLGDDADEKAGSSVAKRPDITLEGPALPGSSQDQAGIDALFESKR